MKIDLNCDLGESFGAYKVGRDYKIMNFISSANIACGFHAGDYMTIEKTVDLATQKQVKIGAHPGFPDLQGFGRRKMHFSTDEIINMMVYQIGALDGFVRSKGGALNHVKPHGALYNMAAENIQVADAVVDAIFTYNQSLILYGLAGSYMEESANRKGLKFKREVFADRGYTKEGRLVSRTAEGAFIHGAKNCAERIADIVEKNRVQAVTGEWISLQAETVCVHGDNDDALNFVQTLKEELELLGHEIG